jgi:hypothetical protein
MPQVLKHLHALRAPALDPGAKILCSDGGDQLTQLLLSCSPSLRRIFKRKVSSAVIKFRAISAYLYNELKEGSQVIACSLYSLTKSLRSLRRLTIPSKDRQGGRLNKF